MPRLRRNGKRPHLLVGAGGLSEEIRLVREEASAAIEDAAVPPSRVVAGGSTALSIADDGDVVWFSNNGAVAVSLPSMASSFAVGQDSVGRIILLTLQGEGALTAFTITPAGGVQIDGAGSGVAYVATVGRVRVSLMSRDGINWFTGG